MRITVLAIALLLTASFTAWGQGGEDRQGGNRNDVQTDGLTVINVVVGLLAALLGGVSAAVAAGAMLGREREARSQLASKHDTLAAEVRTKVVDMDAKIQAAASAAAERRTEQGRLEERLTGQALLLVDLKREKASQEAVDGLRTQLGRIEGKLDSLLASGHQFPLP